MIPGRGCLRVVIIVVLGLGIVGDVGDVVARHWATSKIEQRIRAVAPDAQGVHAHIRSWPFVKVAVTGHVDEMGARIDQVTVQGLTFSNTDVEIHGLKVKQQQLVAHGKVVVEHISSGTVVTSITASSLSKVLGVPVTVGSSGFLVAGLPVTVSIRSSTRTVVITATGASATTVPLPALSLLPCTPTVAFAHQAATLSCSFTQVPSAFTSLA